MITIKCDDKGHCKRAEDLPLFGAAVNDEYLLIKLSANQFLTIMLKGGDAFVGHTNNYPGMYEEVDLEIKVVRR